MGPRWGGGRLHDEELLSLYHSPNIDRVIKSGLILACSQNVRNRNAVNILTDKSTVKRF